MIEEILKEINKTIYTKFPYLSDIEPSKKNLPDGNLQLTYKTVVETDNKFSMPMIVKVKVSKEGKLLAIKTSK